MYAYAHAIAGKLSVHTNIKQVKNIIVQHKQPSGFSGSVCVQMCACIYVCCMHEAPLH